MAGSCGMHGVFSGEECPRCARAVSNWRIARDKIRVITKGAFENCLTLTEDYYLELLDPGHMVAPMQAPWFNSWREGDRERPYIEWLHELRSVIQPDFVGVDYVPAEKRAYHFATLSRDATLALSPEFARVVLSDFGLFGVADLIFTTDSSNRLYVGIKEAGRFHHSSLQAGAPVGMAGGLRVDLRSLRIKRIDNLSGHHRPQLADLVRFIDSLRLRIDLRTIELGYWDGSRWAFEGTAWDFYIAHLPARRCPIPPLPARSHWRLRKTEHRGTKRKAPPSPGWACDEEPPTARARH
jgi:hypothetical protein